MSALALTEQPAVPPVLPTVVVESPFAHPVPSGRGLNQLYARAALRDCLLRGEAPFASHLLYAQAHVLDDDVPAERALGMAAGWAWMHHVALVAVYVDRGISSGMEAGIARAQALGIEVVERSLAEWSRS